MTLRKYVRLTVNDDGTVPTTEQKSCSTIKYSAARVSNQAPGPDP